jgi:hypothetical protein
MLVTGAALGQYIVPMAFLAGAAVSGLRQVKAARLVDTFAGAPSRKDVSVRRQSPTMTWREFETLVGEIEGTDRERREPVMPDVIPGPPLGVNPSCPRCGSAMVLRQAKRGANAGQQFWGCRSFPNCRGTLAAETETTR